MTFPLINQRWPRDLSPNTCNFTRTRNDILQTSPRTRQTAVIRQGRPLWSAEVSWRFANTERLAKLRYWLDGLDGYGGSVQIWDFASPFPGGLRLSTSNDIQPSRLYWTHLAETYNFEWNGLPSHWEYDATVSALAPASAGAMSVSLEDLEPSTIAAIQGQYIQIGRRLYVVAANVSADTNGEATISLTTPLLSAVTAGDAVRLVEAACEMRLASQNFGASATAGDGFITVQASFIETVSDYS